MGAGRDLAAVFLVDGRSAFGIGQVVGGLGGVGRDIS